MTFAVAFRRTEEGIARHKAQIARKVAADDLRQRLAKIEALALREGISDRASLMLEDAARRLATQEGAVDIYLKIERRLCRVFEVTPEAIAGRSKASLRLTLCRQAIMYWAKRRTFLSPAQIGKTMGGRDHSTVYHGLRVYPEKRAAAGRHLRMIELGTIPHIAKVRRK